MKKLTRADLQAIEDYNDEYFFEKADRFSNSVEANSYYLLAGLMGNREAIYRLAKSNQLGVADTQASKKQLTLALLWLSAKEGFAPAYVELAKEEMAKTDKDEELIHYYLTKADDNFHNEPIELQQEYPFVFFELGKHYKSIGQLVEAFDRLMAT